MKAFIHSNPMHQTMGGAANGYVLIPEGNILHGMRYENIDVDVHYGLTFSELLDSDVLLEMFGLGPEDAGSWCVGFDTFHSGDNKEKWPEEAVLKEAERLKENLMALELSLTTNQPQGGGAS